MSNQSQKNTTVATATYIHPEKNALILTTAFLALSANIFGQNPENKTDNPREKKTSRIEKIKGNISSTLIAEGEAQLGDNAKQTAQAIGIVEMNAELNNLFAQIKFSGGVSNCPDDNQFITLCTEFLANVGIKLDDGAIRLSAGKIKLMNDYASTSNLTNIASIGNQNMDLGCLETANSAIILDYVTTKGDRIGLGYIENGSTFCFNDKKGEMVILGAKNLLKDKLNVAGGIKFNSEKAGGFAAVRLNPNSGKTVIMLEGANLGSKDQALIANMNQKIGKLVLSVQAALQDDQAGGAIALHFKNGIYVGAGYKNSLYLTAGISRAFNFGK